MEQSKLDYNGNIILCESPSIELTKVPSVVERFVDCPYKYAGCSEKLEKGTQEETEHIDTCDYRPIACLMDHQCQELVPYHNFILHHTAKHFVTPLFGATLTTSVIFQKSDFSRNQRWAPRLLHCYNQDFFLIVSHRATPPGTWHFWVCMLGTQEEADNYYYEIDICKGEIKKSGTYSVLSIRTEMETIEKQEVAMSVTNSNFRKLTHFMDSLFGSFEIDVAIYKFNSTTPRPSRILLTDDKDEE